MPMLHFTFSLSTYMARETIQSQKHDDAIGVLNLAVAGAVFKHMVEGVRGPISSVWLSSSSQAPE